MIPELYICHCLELCSCHDKFVQLLKEHDEALAKAEAYREVAIRWFRDYPNSPKPDEEEWVDAEAQCILSERKSPKDPNQQMVRDPHDLRNL
jgi:hypothetical protein